MLPGVTLIVVGIVVLLSARRIHAANALARDARKGTLMERIMPFEGMAATDRGLRAIRASGVGFILMGVVLLFASVLGDTSRVMK
jgi:hypothetical protein